MWEKEENADHQHFFLFPQCFQRAFYLCSPGLCGTELKHFQGSLCVYKSTHFELSRLNLQWLQRHIYYGRKSSIRGIHSFLLGVIQKDLSIKRRNSVLKKANYLTKQQTEWIEGCTVNPFLTTSFRSFQTQRICRQQFWIWWKWQKVLEKGTNNCRKRRNCS